MHELRQSVGPHTTCGANVGAQVRMWHHQTVETCRAVSDASQLATAGLIAVAVMVTVHQAMLVRPQKKNTAEVPFAPAVGALKVISGATRHSVPSFRASVATCRQISC